MKTIITGGAGFIGSHLVDKLLESNHEVLVIDNLSTGNIKNIKSHFQDERFSFLNSDISEYSSEFEESFGDIDWVFHLAALASIVPSISNPLDYHKSNVDGTINVLEASRKNNIKRFIYAASSSCYGIPKSIPTSELSEIKPEYPYALTKYIGEEYVMHWNRVYSLPCISLRLFNVYGRRAKYDNYGAVFGVFLKQKLENKPFTVVGDGNQKRDFTNVLDVVDAIVTAAKSDVENEIINIGSDETYSVNELTNLLGGDKIHLPERPSEPLITFADTNKAKSLLKYKPQISFREGVTEMINHIEEWNDAPLWTQKSIETATKDWFKYLK